MTLKPMPAFDALAHRAPSAPADPAHPAANPTAAAAVLAARKALAVALAARAAQARRGEAAWGQPQRAAPVNGTVSGPLPHRAKLTLQR
jgi:hypothetical protein